MASFLTESSLVYLTFGASILALVFSAFLARYILKQPIGTAKMVKICNAIADGAKAYLKRQYAGVAVFFTVVSIILWWMVSKNYLSVFVPFAFLTGGFFSGLAGYLGMTIATRANVRTAQAASKSLNKGLRIAFSSGAIMGMVVVGLGLLDLSIWFTILRAAKLSLQDITATMLTFGMGASSMALFARLGGGIFTKAADVGADLVGKIEKGIPEDDPRNPATIADNVGDNVGDVAGMGADLYESYVGSIVATMALGVAAFAKFGLAFQALTVPLAMAAVGVVASIIGTFFVRASEKASQKVLLRALRKGIYTASALVIVFAYFVIKNALPAQHFGVFYSVITGLIAGNIIGYATEYFTSDNYAPTKSIAKASTTGAATLIIAGIAIGMYSTIIPVLTVVISILCAYFFAGGAASAAMGLYGVGIAAVGMLSTLGITLATDAYGPVADNAGGIAEMAKMKPVTRKRTDALDMLGNTTAATGKGFAIGSAALTALALIAAYQEEVMHAAHKLHIPFVFELSLSNVNILACIFIGAVLPFVFSGMTMLAVGKTAQAIVLEVRRQFKKIKGIMTGKKDPDYAACVKIATVAAQKEMILPTLMAIIMPIVVGLLFGPSGVVAMLVSALATGFVLAIFMANTGGAWDNAKKHIEGGAYGGKGKDAHKAAVIGDTVGDPFKDTAGPSLNILLKLMSMTSLVFSGLVVANYLKIF